MRRILVDGYGFRYRIGRGFAVIECPGKWKRIVPLDTLTGRSDAAIERGQWKKTIDGMVTPRDVANYLRSAK